MALDDTQRRIIEYGVQQGKSRAEVEKALVNYRLGIKKEPAPIEPPARSESFLSDLGGDVVETVQGVGREFGRAGEDIVQTVQSPTLNPFEKLVQATSQAFRGAARGVGEAVVGVGKAVLPQSAEEAVGQAVGDVASNIAQNPEVQNILQSYQALDPETKRNLDNALGFGEGLAEIGTGGAASRVARPIAESAARTIKLTSKDAAELITKNAPPPVNISDIPSFRVFHIAVNPQTKGEAVKALNGAYRDSFIENRTAINNKLDKIAKSRGTSKDELVNTLVQEGYIPEINGRLADFTQTFEDLQRRKSAVISAVDPQLENVAERTSLVDLRNQAAQILQDSPQVVENLDQALNELDRYFNSFQTKYGEQLTAKQVNDIRKAMNQRTKAFGEEAFKQDTADAVADASRNRLDTLVPSGAVREANAEWAKLNNIERTARVFHNQQVDVGVLGRALGSYAGTIAASGIGLGVAGPGGLVIAGLAAHYGGDALADLLRRLRFNPELRNLIVDDLRSDEQLVQKLLKEASPENSKVIEEALKSSIE